MALRPTVGGKVLEINSIRTLFPKNNHEWMNWINQGKLLYVNKEKIQALFEQYQTNPGNVPYFDLDSARSIAQNFVNPQVDFMSEEYDAPMTDAEKSYSESGDKTPTEEVSRKVFGMTNDEIATEMKAAGLEPPKFMRKSHEKLMEQVAALVSNPSYMRKLAHAVARVNRPTSDYENVALNQYFRDCQARVNELNDEIKALGDESNLDDESKKLLKSTKAELRKALALMGEAGRAASNGASEQARALASNRILLDAGIQRV